MGFFTLGIGIAVAVYFFYDGVRNIKNPSSKNIFEQLDENDEDTEPELIKESELHHYLGISKADTKQLMKAYSDIPHISLNGKVYYQKSKLREWLLRIGD